MNNKRRSKGYLAVKTFEPRFVGSKSGSFTVLITVTGSRSIPVLMRGWMRHGCCQM